ncbi:hypothetical protein E1264_23930 [Actinomadura sp. KC216]|nr:hypothetical protein E1264_23930 [Actinomadura sp. KC216]
MVTVSSSRHHGPADIPAATCRCSRTSAATGSGTGTTTDRW